MTAGPAPRRLSTPTMIAFGVGQAGETLRTIGAAGFLLFFYQQIIGLSGTLTSLALSGSLILDALVDPVIGALSDRTRTRWGRRHPFMIAGALPLGFLFYASFNPPHLSQAGYFCWLLVTVLLTRIALSIYHVPYTALAAELSGDYAQRSTLFSFHVFFGTIASTLAPAFALRVFFPTTPEFSPGLLNRAGYQTFSLVFALAMVTTIAISIIGTWRQIPHLTQTPSRHVFSMRRAFIDMLEAFRNPSFRVLFLGLLLTMLTVTVESVFNPYMAPHFWGLTTEQMSTFSLMSLAGLVCAMPLVPRITRRLDKKTTLVASCLISLTAWHWPIAFRLLHFPGFPANGSPSLLPLLLGNTFFIALMGPLIFASLGSMLADIADEHELEVGERREGTIFAARSMAMQLIASVGLVVGGVLLDSIHFPKGARAGSVPADVLWNLGMIPIGAALLNGCGVLFYTRYRLDKKRHAEIMTELTKRRAAARTGGTDAEAIAANSHAARENAPAATPALPAE